MKNKKFLVLGGKGKTGRKVAKLLSHMGYEVRIGSRTEIPSFDWDNPATWTNAIEGMDAIYITYQPDLAVPKALNAIKAFTQKVLESGIRKVVLLSGRGEKEAQLCEQVIMDTELDWTIVRADWFHQNFSEGFFLEPILAGQLALPQSNTAIPFIDTDDIAEVAVKALTEPGHRGKVYELTGPRLLTFEQTVEEISRASRRNILFQSISMEAYVSMLREFQVPEDFIWLVEYLFTNVLDGRNSSLTNDVEKVLGRKAKDFAEYADEMAASGIWNPVVYASVEG